MNLYSSFIIYIYESIFLLLYQLIGRVGRVFANGLGDLGSIPGCNIPMTLKMVLDTYLLNTQQYKVHIKGKVEQSPTLWCRSYCKGSLRVAFNYGCQLYIPPGHITGLWGLNHCWLVEREISIFSIKNKWIFKN